MIKMTATELINEIKALGFCSPHEIDNRGVVSTYSYDITKTKNSDIVKVYLYKSSMPRLSFITFIVKENRFYYHPYIGSGYNTFPIDEALSLESIFALYKDLL